MLESVTVSTFRNYQQATFELAPQTIFVGENGSGKTNVLEAIALLSLTTSWKTAKDSEVVQWGESVARIVSGDREFVVQKHPYFKRIRIDGISKRVGEVVGTLPTVLFQPDDSALVYGSPAYRRQALDRLLSQTVPGYLKALTQLGRVLKQRNKLLKQIQEGQAQAQELDYWDEQLQNDALVIQDARTMAIPVLAAAIEHHFHELVDSEQRIAVVYEKSPKHLENGSFVEHLQSNRYKEIAAGVTLYGPHREDLLFTWGEHLATEGMSRGQVRALVLSFKLAEIEYIELHTSTAPILLLDDVFSEFDEKRRQKVIGLSEKYQTVLTTTEIGHIKTTETTRIITL